MQQNRLSELIFLDGIAILFIVTFHELGGFPDNPMYFIQPYLINFGLGLFTFTAGYKFFFNHSNEIDDKAFLLRYLKKRFIRLYKPYIGYTLLMVFPVIIIALGAEYLFPGRIEGAINFLSGMQDFHVGGIVKFFLGNNPIAFQLYYLVALLVIFGICIVILYLFNTDTLLTLFIPTLFVGFYVRQNGIADYSLAIISPVLIYFPLFVYGMLISSQQQGHQDQWYQFLEKIGPLLFTIVLIFCVLINTQMEMALVYGCALLLPLLILRAYSLFKGSRIILPFTMFCGAYSFYIYLFQWPICLPLLSRLVIDIMGINSIIMPFVISITGIVFCVMAYRFVRLIGINKIFE